MQAPPHRIVAVLAAVVAILLCAAWSLTSAPRPSAAPRPVQVAGVAHLGAAASADVAFLGTRDESVHHHVRAAEHARPGGTPRRPRRAVLPGRQLPPGTQLSGSLLLVPPSDLSRAGLSYDGPAACVVMLPKESRAPPTDPLSSKQTTPPQEQLMQ
jgi:hypothetical protein